jgi:hypothetical protein
MHQVRWHQLKRKRLMIWMINQPWWRDLEDRWVLTIERRKLKMVRLRPIVMMWLKRIQVISFRALKIENEGSILMTLNKKLLEKKLRLNKKKLVITQNKA